ncbi:DNA phosphorothioation system sulfurtransferase DndC [Mesorhizobium tamadayense]|uniref:DNA phosphorothioation system sulfurtransferase DndC n=1 Tax=Mesorhizobium tamadayense TaxID=425306 RepID=A0A3P3FZF5_9HYPH|nr:DNA phosphorothioation system sulfurtransferase DndC [Mesorhizobium tamadayense]RRI03119.1 DNA phosphorothioation system sulfurtransferase DndC [Mesorhizobium tamadayense]
MSLLPLAAQMEEDALEDKLEAAKADLADEYGQNHKYPWIIGFSGGKDSTLVLQLAMEMLLELPPSERKRTVHVVSNDTLVEAPVVADLVDRTLDRISDAVTAMRLPIVVAKTAPKVDQTFWVNLIGRGYPAPSRTFRWCTDRMKIQPTSHYIRSRVSENGEVILLLGVRRQESATRAVSMSRYDNGERLNDHNDLKGCKVFRPIVDFSTDEVWTTLLQRRPPWGGSHRDLVALYKDGQGGECPLVLSKDDAPSCGTSSSRFGCWTCTVVVKDRSMAGFIEAGHENLEPLMDFRDWLAEIRNDPARRSARRRNGQTTFLADGSLVPGPFTPTARREILDRLHQVERATGRTLITAAEIEAINRIWAEDAAAVVASVEATALEAVS